MTKEQLIELGFWEIQQTSPTSSIFFIPYVGEEELQEPYSLSSLFELAWNKAHAAGVEYGKELKAKEVRKVLGI